MHGAILGVFVLAVLTMGLVLLGLPVGGILLVLFRRWRSLLWALPLVNLAIFVTIFLAVSDGGGSADRVAAADNAASGTVKLVLVMIPFLVLSGWVSALMLAPVAIVLRSLSSSRPEVPGQPDRLLEDYLVRPRRSSTWAAFGEGCYAPVLGLAYLRTHRSLWPSAVAPIVLNLLLSGLALLLFLGAVVGFAVYIHPAFPAGWGGVLLEIACGAALLLLALGATLLTWMLLQAVLCSHFYEKLARRVEIQFGMSAEEFRELPLGVQAAEAMRDLGAVLAVNLGLLLLNLVPVLGSIAAIIGFVVYDSYALGAEFLDYPLGLRGWRRAQRRAWTRRFRANTSGLGLAVLLVNFVPVVSSVVLTSAVVGAVLLHRLQERLPPAPEQARTTL